MQAQGRNPKRTSLRLPSWDYSSPAWYFVTICTKHQKPFLGVIVSGEIRLSVPGRIAYQEWIRSAQLRSELALDAFVIMPNHIHGIVRIETADEVGQSPSSADDNKARATGRSPLRKSGPPARSLGSLIAGFKAAATMRINRIRNSPGSHVWQRGYYDHIIRDDIDLACIREYIKSNRRKWELDEYYRGDE
jgi:REP element-mobilizing transposase RayT